MEMSALLLALVRLANAASREEDRFARAGAIAPKMTTMTTGVKTPANLVGEKSSLSWRWWPLFWRVLAVACDVVSTETRKSLKLTKDVRIRRVQTRQETLLILQKQRSQKRRYLRSRTQSPNNPRTTRRQNERNRKLGAAKALDRLAWGWHRPVRLASRPSPAVCSLGGLLDIKTKLLESVAIFAGCCPPRSPSLSVGALSCRRLAKVVPS